MYFVILNILKLDVSQLEKIRSHIKYLNTA